MAGNTLYYGDNLDVLRRHVRDESVNLIYLDPPFNSNQGYNVLFAEHSGERSASQIRAFKDTWKWDLGAEAAFVEVVEGGGKVADALRAMRMFLGQSDMMAYLAMMAPRLMQLHRVLKPTGSIFLHCDPTASHYLKVLMDAVFGTHRCINEIIWHYYNKMQGNIQHFPENHDTIFWYSKSPEFTFNVLKEKRDKPIRQLKREWDGKLKRLVNAKGPDGKCVYITTDERRIDDVWTLSMLQPAGREMLGYPTQKPEALLERIVRASSNEGDAILDPFCGCGTAIAVAHRLNRQWIGIDITHLAIGLIKHRLRDGQAVEPGHGYSVVGEPTDIAGAAALAAEDPYQFQWWSLGLVGARPVEQKKGADKGIDGKLYFHDEAEGAQTKLIVFSVKAGNVTASHLRDLRGVLEREDAAIGVLISMESPTKAMRTEAATAGFYTSPGWKKKYPRIQLLTIAELLKGEEVQRPPRDDRTFRKAPTSRVAERTEAQLFDDDEDGEESTPTRGRGKPKR